MIQGFRRAAFSNEAGVGSASIAHSAVRTKEPITEGLVALHEPFIDTVVICTMTALVIVVTGAYDASGGMGGRRADLGGLRQRRSLVPLRAGAGGVPVRVLDDDLLVLLRREVPGPTCSARAGSMELIYKLIFCIFVVIGSSMSLGPVVDLSDSAIFAMAIANIIGLYILFPVVKRDLESYWSRLQAGQLTRYRTSWLIHVD